MQRQFWRARGHELTDSGNRSRRHEDSHDCSGQELKSAGLKSRIVLQIHDELLIETARDEIEAVKETDRQDEACRGFKGFTGSGGGSGKILGLTPSRES